MVFGVPVAALAVAGCATATNSQNPGRMQIRSDQAPPLGQVLVNETGRTLYLFVADPPNQSTCSGACASIWPPATTQGPPRAAGGAQTAEITTIARSDGPRQLVYAGHPLYYYQADTGRGDTRGQGLTQFGAGWYAISPQGQQVAG
ncbi:COG4315 family predicted lipoprotein [Spirillospora sp. NBC_01491]|uniref:COG4315 family predicted lipoprotein n=1 Tax=Spirillospora sp. NBC_01491 TaxID=2976007 RepID=UPI002E32DF52|nr:hypothetical protein [Spirillospora sp. NBC_01491]